MNRVLHKKEAAQLMQQKNPPHVDIPLKSSYNLTIYNNNNKIIIIEA
jgi:hypothetical protein